MWLGNGGPPWWPTHLSAKVIPVPRILGGSYQFPLPPNSPSSSSGQHHVLHQTTDASSYHYACQGGWIGYSQWSPNTTSTFKKFNVQYPKSCSPIMAVLNANIPKVLFDRTVSEMCCFYAFRSRLPRAWLNLSFIALWATNATKDCMCPQRQRQMAMLIPKLNDPIQLSAWHLIITAFLHSFIQQIFIVPSVCWVLF